MAGGLLYLSEADIARLALGPEAIQEALEDGLRASRGNAHTAPKLAVPIGPGHFFQAMPAAVRALGLAGVKWVGVTADNAARGLPNVNSIIVLSDIDDARPVAILAGDWITAVRTAAMTVAVAKRLARRDSETIAFVGLGLQARSHLAALRPHFPKLRRALIFGRSENSRAAFSELAKEASLEPMSCRSADEIYAVDIIVTTVPAQPGFAPFLDARRLRPGAFAAMVDLGRSWIPETIRDLDLVATDDRAQSKVLAEQGKLSHGGPWAAELIELVSGAPGRVDPTQRTAFIFAGMALCDLVVAAAIYRRALTRGVGTTLSA